MDERHLNALDQLSHGADPSARRDAANQLFGFEQQGEISEEDLLTWLVGPDLVAQSHAVRGLGELKSQRALKPMGRLFLASQDPLLLQELLESFVLIGGDSMLSLVMRRVDPPFLAAWLRTFRKKNRPPQIFDEPFILEQILLDLLKYLQTCGQVRLNRFLKNLLNHENPMIRLNCLRLYDRIGNFPPPTTLEKLQHEDPHPLVRQQALSMAQPT